MKMQFLNERPNEFFIQQVLMKGEDLISTQQQSFQYGWFSAIAKFQPLNFTPGKEYSRESGYQSKIHIILCLAPSSPFPRFLSALERKDKSPKNPGKYCFISAVRFSNFSEFTSTLRFCNLRPAQAFFERHPPKISPQTQLTINNYHYYK
jgi:hypothetical protein